MIVTFILEIKCWRSHLFSVDKHMNRGFTAIVIPTVFGDQIADLIWRQANGDTGGGPDDSEDGTEADS